MLSLQALRGLGSRFWPRVNPSGSDYELVSLAAKTPLLAYMAACGLNRVSRSLKGRVVHAANLLAIIRRADDLELSMRHLVEAIIKIKVVIRATKGFDSRVADVLDSIPEEGLYAEPNSVLPLVVRGLLILGRQRFRAKEPFQPNRDEELLFSLKDQAEDVLEKLRGLAVVLDKLAAPKEPWSGADEQVRQKAVLGVATQIKALAREGVFQDCKSPKIPASHNHKLCLMYKRINTLAWAPSEFFSEGECDEIESGDEDEYFTATEGNRSADEADDRMSGLS